MQKWNNFETNIKLRGLWHYVTSPTNSVESAFANMSGFLLSLHFAWYKIGQNVENSDKKSSRQSEQISFTDLAKSQFETGEIVINLLIF